MSETSVLLPSASITVFSNEDGSLEVAKKLADDWRFARVEVSTQSGSVSEAIEYYKQYGSPDLLIIQTDTIDESFTDKLGELAGNCSEGTDAIIVGPDNDVQLYRKLIDMGVSDYMVRPLELDVFSEVVAKTLIAKLGVVGSRLIVTLGGKGGLGVSSLTQGMALGFSALHGQKTLLMDGAGGWSTNVIALGLEPSTTLNEAAKAAQREDQDSLDRMILNVNDKLSVLASGGDVLLDQPVDVEGLESLLNMLMTSYPIVLFDASHMGANLRKAVLMLAHKIVLVSSPTLFSLRLSRSLLGEIKELRGISESDEAELVSLVLNMKGLQEKSELSVKEIEDMMEFDIAHTIDFDPKLFGEIEGQGGKITEHKEGSPLIQELLAKLIPTISGLKIDVSDESEAANDSNSGIGGFLNKITGKG